MVEPDGIRLGVGVDVGRGRVVAPSSMFDPCSAMTMLTQPFGPTTSFTKKATSLIIGPQPASYQPTDPSSNSTCRWP